MKLPASIGPLRAAVLVAALFTAGPTGLVRGQTLAPSSSADLFHEADARRWLTYLSSDLMQGRAVFTEGYGLASSYIAEQLREMGVEPLGEDGTYFQPVVRKSYRVRQNASVTVEAGGDKRTFVHGTNITVPVLAGAPQTVRTRGVAFVGYGLSDGPAAKDLGGKLAIYVSGAPRARRPGTAPRSAMTERGQDLIRSRGAAAAIGFTPGRPSSQRARPAAASEAGDAQPVEHTAEVTTVRRMDVPIAPVLTADETFFDFLFKGSATSFADIRAKAAAGEPLASSSLDSVVVTISVENVYETLQTDRTQNVVGIVRGTDPALAGSSVFFAAHLDHAGYVTKGDQAPGRVNTPIELDPIWNGADDDGSGSTAVLALAKAFATGPKPRRSVVFVWHAGEEEGLLGSERMVDAPVVPLESIQAVFNIDMIGRNRDNNPAESDTLYLIGADRISTDLHNLLIETNDASPRPLTLDFEYNDPADPNTYYTRSDHYSYASHGIPAAFFFTGSHPDYHANTDTVDKILFPKLLRITRFIYDAGMKVANSERTLVHDNQGPRSGRGFQGLLPKAPL